MLGFLKFKSEIHQLSKVKLKQFFCQNILQILIFLQQFCGIALQINQYHAKTQYKKVWKRYAEKEFLTVLLNDNRDVTII